MNYKSIGILNIGLGFIQTFILGTYLIFTAPKLTILYENLNIDNSRNIYLYPVLGILLGIGNLILGLINLNIFLKQRREKLYQLSIAYLIISFLLTGFLVIITSMGSLGPLYNL